MHGIRFETREQIGWIQLDNEPSNGFYAAMVRSLADALRAAGRNPDTRAVVITGTGDVFCGGVDASRLDPSQPTAMAGALVDLFQLVPALEIPVIVAANGDALASGFSLLCAADIAIAVDGARLGTYEAGVDLWPTIAQVPVLHRLSARHAFENILTGVPFTAERALQIGAINEIVPVAELDAAATRWALAASVSSFTRTGRPAAHRFASLPYEQALDESLDLFVKLIQPK